MPVQSKADQNRFGEVASLMHQRSIEPAEGAKGVFREVKLLQ